jgi:dGTPase
MEACSEAGLGPMSETLATPDASPWNRRMYEGAPGASQRSSYEVDRDRIVHSETFRQMQHKTQVQGLVGRPTGPSFRTRLNHVIEVAQIGRSIAVEVGADQPLVEAISLAHDLGHPPFGHAGERALRDALVAAGEADWNANVHSLDVVDRVEPAFMDFPGLNLTWAVREGIARHSTPFDRPVSFGEFAETPQAGLESQVVDAADVLAYLSHDLDDALSDGFVSIEDLGGISPILDDVLPAATGSWSSRRFAWPNDERDNLVQRFIVAHLIGLSVRDLAETSLSLATANAIGTPEDVRSTTDRTVAQSGDFQDLTRAILSLLTERYYRSEEVRRTDAVAERTIRALFEWFVASERSIPARFRDSKPAVAAATYIASLDDHAAWALALELGLSKPSSS